MRRRTQNRYMETVAKRVAQDVVRDPIIKELKLAEKGTLEKASRAFLPTSITEFPATSSYNKPGLLQFRTMNRIYEQSAIVRMVVDTKINHIGMLDWDIEPKESKNKLTPSQESARDDIRRLFRRPNPNGDVWDTFIRRALKDLFVLDAMVIEKVIGGLGQISELYSIDGGTITPLVDEHGTLQKYEQRVKPTATYYSLQTGIGFEEKVAVFDPRDLVYIVHHPSNSRVWGRSPLETLTVEVGADLYAMNYNAMNFVEGQLSKKVLILGKIGERALIRAEEVLQEQRGKGHRLPVIADLEEGAKGASLLNLQDSPKDMEFMEFETWLLKRVAGVYQISVNEVMELYQSATRASAKTQQDIHQNKGIKPILSLISEKFTCEIVEEFDPGLKFEFSNVFAAETEKNRAELMKLKLEAGMPLNRILTEEGEDPITDMEVTLPNGKTVNPYDYPLNMAANTVLGVGKAAPPGMGGSLEAEYGMPMRKQPLRLEKEKKKPRIRMSARHWHRETDRLQAGLSRRLRPLWKRLAAAVRRHLDLAPPPVLAPPGATVSKASKNPVVKRWADGIIRGAMGETLWEGTVQEETVPDLTEAYLMGAKRGAASVGVSLDPDIYKRDAYDFVANRFYTKGVLFEMTDNMRDQLADKLATGIESGKTMDEMKAELATYLKDAEDYQVERIVRSEVINAANQGTFQYWGEEVGVTKFEFVVAGDSCPICQEVAAGNPYSLKEIDEIGDYGDGYPHPNCRDTWVPAVDRDEAEALVEAAG